jgi:nitrite reductase/ring-hydroxylating ferredoxin subunit
MSRFRFPVPYGWFYIAEKAGLEVGAIRQVRRFGRDLILWRGEDGAPHLQDAYCPHLGANIAVGGKVVGNTVECPFHRWRFNGDGSVAAIPYATKINPYACLSAYPLMERYGNLMAWYHPNAAAPQFELPNVEELEDTDFVGPVSQAHLIHTCLQEMAENTVDGAHFQTVHGHPGAASYDGFEFDGPRMKMQSKQLFPSSRGPVEGTLSSESWGYGFAVVRYRTVINICMITVNAPVEADVVEQVFQVYWRNPARDPQIDRIGQAFAKEVNRQIQQDQPIWEAKIYREKPYLCDGDGPFVRFRSWAKQFYADVHPQEAVLASAQ